MNVVAYYDGVISHPCKARFIRFHGKNNILVEVDAYCGDGIKELVWAKRYCKTRVVKYVNKRLFSSDYKKHFLKNFFWGHSYANDFSTLNNIYGYPDNYYIISIE